MCLYAIKTETDYFLKRHRHKEEITVWKLVYCSKPHVKVKFCLTACMYSPIQLGATKGVKRPRKRITKNGRVERGGIHVLLTRKKARQEKKGLSYYYRVIKCKAKLEDLIGVGRWGLRPTKSDSAAFKKIKVGYSEKKGPT